MGIVGGALTLSACGGPPDPANGPGDALKVPVRAATCSDWSEADAASRLRALAELRALRGDQIAGRSTGRGYGSVLDDDLAYRLFEDRCSLPNSETFLLYRLYSFAAGFAGGAP